MPHKLELSYGALPVAYARETNDPQILLDDDVFLTLRCTNVGDEPTDHSMTVMVNLTHHTTEILKNYKEIRPLHPKEHEDLSWDVPHKLEAGDYHMAVVAFTRDIGEHEPVHVMEYKFAVEPRYRHVKVITDEKGDTIEGGIGHTSPAEKALNEVRVRATLSIVDWIGVPLTGYRVELTDEGHQVHADEAKGAPLAFPEVLVHTANGMLHVEAKPAGSGAFGPRGLHLKGDLPYQYTKDSQDIVLRGWQRFETQDVQKAKLHSYTDQLTKSGKVSFKIFDDVGGEVSLAEATSDTDTTSEATTYHVRIAHEGLSDQEQK